MSVSKANILFLGFLVHVKNSVICFYSPVNWSLKLYFSVYIQDPFVPSIRDLVLYEPFFFPENFYVCVFFHYAYLMC